jgi:N-methylhydantoinase A
MGFAPGAVDQVASGLLALANVQMGAAIKEVTVERGKDIRESALFAFGGGGPLHACDIARELNVSLVLVPPEPGNFSALGMLFAPARIDEARTIRLDLETGSDALGSLVAEMEAAAAAALQRDFESKAVAFERLAEMRYKGQRHTIRVPLDTDIDAGTLRARFLDVYRKRYGRAERDALAEIVGVRVTALADVEGPDLRMLHRAPQSKAASPQSVRDVYFAANGRRLKTPVFSRYDLPLGFTIDGPAVIEEFGATCVIGPGDRLEVGQFGELRIAVAGRQAVQQ